jgi:hypothetical protein
MPKILHPSEAKSKSYGANPSVIQFEERRAILGPGLVAAFSVYEIAQNHWFD